MAYQFSSVNHCFVLPLFYSSSNWPANRRQEVYLCSQGRSQRWWQGNKGQTLQFRSSTHESLPLWLDVLQGICLLIEVDMVLAFAHSSSLGIVIFVLVIFSIFMQSCEGSTFGIVPYVDPLGSPGRFLVLSGLEKTWEVWLSGWPFVRWTTTGPSLLWVGLSFSPHCSFFSPLKATPVSFVEGTQQHLKHPITRQNLKYPISREFPLQPQRFQLRRSESGSMLSVFYFPEHKFLNTDFVVGCANNLFATWAALIFVKC